MKSYLYSVVAITLFLCGVVATINYFVDPYSIYHFSSADSKRLSRIDQFSYMRLTKPWYINQLKPEAIVVGSSRAARVPPLIETEENRGNYNLSVPGISIYELYRLIQHAHAHGPLTHLAIGLDFERLYAVKADAREGFEEDRVAHSFNEIGSLRSYLQLGKDGAATLFSLPALSHSISAIGNTKKPQRTYFKDGTWETTGTAFTGRAGYLYVGKNFFKDSKISTVFRQQNLAILADILRFCHEHAIETQIFLTPEHVFQIKLLQKVHGLNVWRDLHHELIEINRQIADEMGEKPFSLWGFNDAQGMVDEPLYRSNDAANAWFNDGVHFRKKLGVKIISAVWGDDTDIGTKLTTATIDEYLLQVDQLIARFERRHGTDMNKLFKKISPTL